MTGGLALLDAMDCAMLVRVVVSLLVLCLRSVPRNSGIPPVHLLACIEPRLFHVRAQAPCETCSLMGFAAIRLLFAVPIAARRLYDYLMDLV